MNLMMRMMMIAVNPESNNTASFELTVSEDGTAYVTLHCDTDYEESATAEAWAEPEKWEEENHEWYSDRLRQFQKLGAVLITVTQYGETYPVLAYWETAKRKAVTGVPLQRSPVRFFRKSINRGRQYNRKLNDSRWY